MLKRGGGQRYNNNNNGGGGGTGSGGNDGFRYSALKNFEENQRRKDRRRVSFKPFPHKKDQKLRVEGVRRLWEDDDDMTEPTSLARDSRRRGSPIPRGKFGKLISNSYGWYQVTIANGQMYEKETLIHALMAAMSPHDFVPQYWRVERHGVIFFTDDYELAERIQQLGRHTQLPDGVRLIPRVRSGMPSVTINDDLKQKMKVTMAKRYNVLTKALDLSRFQDDVDIKPVFCPLFRSNVMSAALDIICENIPDIEAINLNDNNMTTMEAFKSVEKRLPHLKILHLGGNKLLSLDHLMVFRNLPIVELILRNNPCRSRYKDSQHFLSKVRHKFPKLQRLDGETLEPQVNFDLNESATTPTTKASFLCENSGADLLRQFLDQYFNIFDSENRQLLLDAYHEHALLSVSMPSANHVGRLNSFWKYNRNLRRIGNNEREDLRWKLLKNGRLACVSTLNEWPRTIHERATFTVDLTLYNPQMMVFTVTGLFKELAIDVKESSSATPAYELRHFMRTFVVVPQNTGFCIRNEIIFITNVTQDQLHEYKLSLQQTATGSGAAQSVGATTVLANNSLQNRLYPGGYNGAGAIVILPTLVNAGASETTGSIPPNDDATKLQMVQTLSAQSQMNLDWSRKCLEETNWDFNHAAFVFDKLFKENKIPPEAFAK